MRTLLNILWNVPGLGFVAALCWVLAGLVMAVTIIGIPFAWAHLKLAAAAIAPVGKVVVPAEVAMAIDREKASGWLYGRRR